MKYRTFTKTQHDIEKGKTMKKYLAGLCILILILATTGCQPDNTTAATDEISAEYRAPNHLLENKINSNHISAIHFISDLPGEDFFGLKVITDRDEILEIVYVLNHATIGTRHEPYDGGVARMLLLNNDMVMYEFNFGATGYSSVFLNDTRDWMYNIQFSGTTLLELRQGSSAKWEYVYR